MSSLDQFVVYYMTICYCCIASEVFDMNHEATRLTEHLTVLRKASQTLSDSLTQNKEEREEKKKEEEKERKGRLDHLNEAIVTTQVELEVSSF